nr:MAG TPA: Endodeoxyribonuclease RusA [Caudoviricetes sp.]
MTTKKCIRCGEEKPLSEYHKSGLDAYGNSMFKSKCKVCVSIEAKYYRENNKEALKQKRQELREKTAADVGVLMREAARKANQAFPLLSLPYPISTNRYWRTFRNRQIVSKEAVAYKARVAEIARQEGIIPTDKLVKLSILVVPKAKKDGTASKVCIDLDNALKVAIDALQGSAYHNDKQVRRLVDVGYADWAVAGGGLVVKVEELDK